MKLILYIPEKEIPTKQDIISIDIHFMDGKIVECDCPFIELKQEPCDDAISRQAVLDLISKFIFEIHTEGGRDLNAHTNDVLRQILRNVGSDRVLSSVNPQEPNTDILDKIRAEIEQLETYYDNDYFSGNRDAMFKCNDVLEIIDKYKTESEE